MGGEIGKDEMRTILEVGFWVAEPFWGKGIATEAIQMNTEYILDRFPEIKRIYSQVFDFNASSKKVLGNAGFVAEAILKDAYIKHGKVGDPFQYVIVRSEVGKVER